MIKIRLQLQIHSLSDPLSHRGITGPIYKGTVGTARSILREEGIRVRLGSTPQSEPSTDMGVGVLEGQHSCRIAVRHVRCYPILPLSELHFFSPHASSSRTASRCRRILRKRCCGRRSCNNSHIPARPSSNPLRCARLGEGICGLARWDQRYQRARRAKRLLPWPHSCSQSDRAVHGLVLRLV